MAALSDNLTGSSSKASSTRTGEGVVIDIGTGDGRFVYRMAREDPQKFFIGIDANARPLKKISMKATRKTAKGGAPNALFIQAAVEDLPEELNGVADEIHIHFPWGSLLRAVALGDKAVLAALRRIAAPGCTLEVIIGIDPGRDRAELERLGVPELTPVLLHSFLIPKYIAAGFTCERSGILERAQWQKLDTTWARRLQAGAGRRVVYLILAAA